MAAPIEITAEDLRRIQLLELDILKEIDRIARKNNIRYTLSGGSLLGAVRHKGIIPWDDDIDVAMLREDYDRFFEACKRDLNHDKYFAQTMDTDPTYQIAFGRVLLKHTVFQRSGQEHVKVNNGFFVEIFPRDDISDCLFIEKLQMLMSFIMRKMLYARMGKCVAKSCISRCLYWLLDHNAKNNAQHILNFLQWLTYGKNHERVLCWGIISGWEWEIKKKGMYVFLRDTLIEYWGYIFLCKKRPKGITRQWFQDLENVPFEDMTVMITRYYDKWLSGKYGDYMKIPPADQRERHKIVSKIDFGPYKDKLKI